MSSGTMSTANTPMGGQPFMPQSGQAFVPQTFRAPQPVENPFFGGRISVPNAPIPMDFGMPTTPFSFSPSQGIPMDFGLPNQGMRSTFMPVNRPIYQAGAANRAYEAEQAAIAAAAARAAEQAAIQQYTPLETQILQTQAAGQDPWQLQAMQGSAFEDAFFGNTAPALPQGVQIAPMSRQEQNAAARAVQQGKPPPERKVTIMETINIGENVITRPRTVSMSEYDKNYRAQFEQQQRDMDALNMQA